MNVSNLPTGTVTMLFTDIEGSTRLWQRLGTEQFTAIVPAHRRALRAAFSAHGGQEIVDPLLTCGGALNHGGFCDRRIDALARRASARQADDPHAAFDLWADVDFDGGGLSQLWVH